MSKSNATETALLQLLFQNANFANLGDATGVRGSTVAGSLYFALHSSDPGEAGNQSTSEVTYTGYARAAVVRSAGGFTVSGNQVNLAADLNFAASSGGGSAATHWSVGVASSGAGVILYKGALSATINCQNSGTTPQLGTGTNITED